MNLLKSILYVPLIEIFFTVIVCDKNYFVEEYICWNSEHITYFILSLISFFLLFILSYNFTSLSFDNKEKFSSEVSKYLIINTDLTLLICRPIYIILLELCVVTDLTNIAIIFFFISSFFCAYCIFIERKYQSYEDNISLNIKYIFNLFFFVNSLMLLISNLIKKKKFFGMFYIFIIISITFIFYFFSKKERQYNVFKKPKKTDREIYNNIRIIIQLIENKNKNRHYLLKLLSYSFNLTYGEQLTKVKNLSPLKKIVDLYNKRSKKEELSKVEFYFCQYIEDLYKDALKIFRDSPLLLVNYAIFQLEKMHRYNKAYRILLKCLFLPDLNYSQEFFIYRIKRNLEEKGVDLGKEQSNISYTYQINNLLTLVSQVSYSYSQLYNILLNNSKIMDINNLKDIAIKIDTLNNKINESYKMIESCGFNNKKISVFYDNFLKDILNDNTKKTEYLDDEFEEGIKIENNFFDINSLNLKSDIFYIVASGNNQNLGTILKISLEICELLGYSDKELLGQNINIFIPNILRIPHENFLREKVNNTTPMEEYSEKNVKNIPVYFRSSAKFLIPIFLEVGIFLDENNIPILFGKLGKNNNDFYKKCVVIINSNLIIQMFTPNAYNLLGLDSTILNNNVEISTFFLEFYSECLNYFSSHSNETKDILSIKIKLIKEIFLNNDNNIITWKNHNKFRVEWKELKIKKKIYGYSIFFEPLEPRTKEKVSFMESVCPSPKNSKSIKTQNIELFPLINKNYIPEITSKVNFDLNEKTYIMIDKNKEENNNENIKEYFKKKYTLTNYKENNKKKEESSFKNDNHSSVFESENSSNYENEYSEDSSYEEEEEKEKNENNIIKEKPTLKEIIIENPGDKYYQVKLKKVFLHVYDFKSNIIKEAKNYIVQSKMEKLLKKEKDLTHNKLMKKFSEKIDSQNVNLKFSLMKNNKEIKYDDNISNKIIEKIIKKIISPKLMNKNALYYLFFYIFQFISIVTLSIFLFITLFNSIHDIYSVYILIYTQCDLINNIGIIHYYVSEYVLLKNPHYYNFYQSNRTKYRENILKILKELYHKSMNEIISFDYDENKFSNKNKEKLKNLNTNFISCFPTDDYNNDNTMINLSPDNAIKEYVFSLFKFIISKDTEINFLNINLKFIHDNALTLSEIMSIKSEIYIDCLNSLINHTKFISFINFGIFFIISMIVCSFSVSARIKIIREKEKYLGMFYKIEPEIIKNMYLKCEKYTKIQINNDNLINTNNYFEIGNDDNEIDSLLDTKDNEYNNYVKDKYYHDIIKKKNSIKNKKIINNIEFQRNIIFEVIFIVILSAILLIIILILYSSYKYFTFSSLLNYYIITEERYLFIPINSLKVLIIKSGIFYYNQNEYQKLVNLIPQISKNYSLIKQIEIEIHLISSKYNLPGNSSLILNSYASNSFCHFFSNFSEENNIECDNFAFNISNFGLPTIHTYYFNSIIQTAFLCLTLGKNVIEDKNIYYDIYYDTPKYVDIYNNNEFDEKNPFNSINSEEIRDSNIIFTYLLNPLSNYLIKVIYENITDYEKHLRNLIVIIIIIFYSVVVLTYIIFIFPVIVKENKDLNRTKIILGVIPKNILYEIIQFEYLNEQESK